MTAFATPVFLTPVVEHAFFCAGMGFRLGLYGGSEMMFEGNPILLAGALIGMAAIGAVAFADEGEEPLIQPKSASLEPVAAKGLPLDKARRCIVGHDHNRPDHFPGLGDFIGWNGDIVRLANGELMFVHSAGYWHVSFATPVLLTGSLKKSYSDWRLDLDHEAPTGGRIMCVRSSDNGKTWTKPVTLFNNELDNGPSATFVTRKGTVIQFVNVQASWYGFKEAPPGHQKLNTRQLVVRSTDNGKTWGKAAPLESSGTFYTRGRSSLLQLPDGGILWMAYNMDKGAKHLYGTIHRSDDDGKTWRIISKIRREGVHTDEGDMVRLSNGRIVLVLRPDGGVMVSDDNGVNWRQISRIEAKSFYAPHMTVLKDDTIVCTAGGSGGQCVFLTTDGGMTWSRPIRVDPGVYGYGKLFLMADETILMSYVMSGSTPNRSYLVRFKVNEKRTGIQLLAVGE